MTNVMESEVDRFEKYEQQEMYMKASTLLVTICQTYSCIAVATTIKDTRRGLERTFLDYMHTGLIAEAAGLDAGAVAGGDGRVDGVAQRVRRSSSEFRKLCDGFEAGEKSGYAAKDTKKEHSAIKHTFASIFDKLSANNDRGTSPRPKYSKKHKKI